MYICRRDLHLLISYSMSRLLVFLQLYNIHAQMSLLLFIVIVIVNILF